MSHTPFSTPPDERIRVAFCVDNFNVGGTELNAVRTAERLDRTAYHLEVACLQPDGPLRARYEAAGITPQPFPLRSLYHPTTVTQGLRFARWLRERRIDVLHCHDIYSNVFAAPWARLAGVPMIASRRWWARVPRVGMGLANRTAYGLSARVLANAPRVADLLAEVDGIPRGKLVVVPNFLDASAFLAPEPAVRAAFLRELTIPPTARLIGIVANLRPVKDHAILLRAAARLLPYRPDVHVVLVGEGESRTPLEALARELSIADRVHFAGRRPSVPNLHHLFEVSVLCSRSEALSNSILEAMAAARPVVATDVGASRDAVIDGETGLLTPPGDPVQLAAALERLLRDPEGATALGSAGRQRARAVFSEAGAFTILNDLYREVAGRHPAPTHLRHRIVTHRSAT